MVFSLGDVESCLQRKSWWAVFFILPFVRRLALYLANRTQITPNQITVAAFALVPPVAVLFAQGTYWTTILAVVLFELNYLLDCVDGTIARLKKNATPAGGYLDAILDRVRIVLLCLALGHGYWISHQSIAVFFWLLLYLGVNNLIIISRGYQERTLAKAGFASRLGGDLITQGVSTSLLARWFHFTQRRNLMPYFHDVELDALVFVVGPLVKQPVVAIQIAVAGGLFLFFALNLVFLRELKKQRPLGVES
ncbi:CDP-alcohol phosphatidyltransferase family protein [Desulfuromonas thiophila]|uniref:CDP-alcohol phosphatidyltransferase n=1 Tax=Desulfuromonas thiophila TaxID=57664 RepID=A0A1G7ETE4_9BACT|nr:CDP-alcohol phosphatidyltransferase family protein [Desulfuromonas thiophila]SDE66960.1 CDP-alcohol phosphatidyltransferase [Desulfuromonas thiophila]